MQWLLPQLGLIAGAISIPTLLLLYFLKLKRQERSISSTLLWKRAVQDLQVNAPFQRLRRNLLLLLQLLALIAVLLALAGPMLMMNSGPAQRVVLLIDRSASMNATDVAPSRLAEAKRQARLAIDSLRDKSIFSFQDRSDKAMVVAFDHQVKVMSNFTSDKKQLLAAIEAIPPGDGGSKLSEAVVVAQAFAQSAGDEVNNRSSSEPPKLILFSDGAISDYADISISQESLTYNCIGETNKNIAITAMQTRRSYENPDDVHLFATLANYGETEAAGDVQLSLNENVLSVRSIAIPAAAPDRVTQKTEPGKTAVNFTLSNSGTGILEIRQMTSDPLDRDDAAWSVLAPPRRLSLLLVTAGNVALETALSACPLERMDRITPEEFDAKDPVVLQAEGVYDVIILDRHVPSRYPRGHYLVFGRAPADLDIVVTGQVENQFLVDWRNRHPVTQYLDLGNLFVARAWKLELPREAEILAEFNEAPAMVMLHRKGSDFLIVNFNVLDSNWPFDPSLVMFCYNAISVLGAQLGQNTEQQLKVGEPIVYENVEPETPGRIESSETGITEIKANPSGVLRFPGTHRVGIYQLEAGDQDKRLYAVNLLDSKESRIEPVRELALSGQRVVAQEESAGRTNQPLWPYLIVLALLLAICEWLVYNSKVRL
jgi:hypothetical protein